MRKKLAEKDLENIGKILIKTQILETQIKLFISLLKVEIKKKYKIEELDEKSILSNSNTSKKTLGRLMNILKTELPIFDVIEFQELLNMRNLFVHSFHEKYLSNNNVDILETRLFIKNFDKLIVKFIKIFTGLLVISTKIQIKNKNSTNNLKKLEFYDLEEYENVFSDFVINNIK
ncbi:hypothetical protein KO506_06955 [Polaribacter vadi]|uniref:hypothetical protein n=1 Tax=Polaribacter TaxID=52959 RepID=UPI001C09D623|nr:MULTISPECIES: hypothetical protein [Polaribacter]MBU3011135.1 hypothetical protein [Polaribacter vadi]MDO6740949.1 hypothetical protein [Polaribacter sp. 1_MG-2023]